MWALPLLLRKMMKFAQDNDLVIQATSYMFPPLRKDSTQIGQNNRFSPNDASLYGAYICAYSNGFDNFKAYVESGQIELYDTAVLLKEIQCVVAQGLQAFG